MTMMMSESQKWLCFAALRHRPVIIEGSDKGRYSGIIDKIIYIAGPRGQWDVNDFGQKLVPEARG